ncbi:M48 family metallopeptidase [Pseudopontixanthobacter vadosimaris]|uniref:M48 family metallopeptidase n=1 Tax=Pseudopontixanthobacter vadosimaris TaxID=2726450 RepID=UPI00147369D2|nr:SprT family zinc-dependent metalloprotease [Pseudopontixanthobacter vadosimaris]
MIDWLLGRGQHPEIRVAGRVLPIAIIRHATARRMILRLSPDGSEVRVTLPRWGRTAEAVAFAHSRSDWLARQAEALPRSTPPACGGTLQFRGRSLLIRHDVSHPRKPNSSGDTVTLGGPAETIPARLQRWLEEQALPLFAADAAEYAQTAGVPMPPVRLSRARRRWGSCSSDGVLRLNWRLVQAPDCVRRSVVAHEIAHLVHFDHSPQFHALLERIYGGDLTQANAWLKASGPGLYASFG